MVSKRFHDEGFDVTALMSGTEALGTAKKILPDIILMNLILPGLDGFAVLKQLKADSKTKRIPVVVMSELEQAADAKSAKALGAEAYFLKTHTEFDKIVEAIKKRVK